MVQIDPDDDSVWRWVIQHYRLDPQRRERRNVGVAAYDNEAEFQSELRKYGVMIRDEIAAGGRSPDESVSGVTLEPGYLAASARGHSVRRAVEHGVSPGRILRMGPLPSNMAVLSSTEDETGAALERD